MKDDTFKTKKKERKRKLSKQITHVEQYITHLTRNMLLGLPASRESAHEDKWMNDEQTRADDSHDKRDPLVLQLDTARGTRSTLVVLALLAIACTRVPDFVV